VRKKKLEARWARNDLWTTIETITIKFHYTWLSAAGWCSRTPEDTRVLTGYKENGKSFIGIKLKYERFTILCQSVQQQKRKKCLKCKKFEP
jgi:hypothetical protein